MNPDGATSALNELREDSRLCKNRHFSAADRKQLYHVYCGLPVMIMTVLTGTVLVNILKSDSPPQWATTTATVLAFLSATLSGLQTFFNFHRAAEGHRSVANRYQEIGRRCKHLIQKDSDKEIDHDEIWATIETIRQDYAKINVEAEAFTTNDRDFANAKRKLSITPFQAPSANSAQKATNSPTSTEQVTKHPLA